MNPPNYRTEIFFVKLPSEQFSNSYRPWFANARFRLNLVLLALSVFAAQPGRGADLERWLYCSQNLWVDENIDYLDGLLRRAAKAGYTHVESEPDDRIGEEKSEDQHDAAKQQTTRCEQQTRRGFGSRFPFQPQIDGVQVHGVAGHSRAAPTSHTFAPGVKTF